jgi:lipopolysaccharide biosynthesis glycosyltransferase
MATIPIVLSTNENYAPYCATTIASLLVNSKKETELNFYILAINLSKKTRNKFQELKKIKNCSIDFIIIDKNDFKHCPITRYFSIETYFRFKLASLLPNIDKIIYLDSDMIISEDILDLFNTDIRNYHAGMILNSSTKGFFYSQLLRLGLSSSSYYFNTGLILLNLNKWRSEKIEQKLFEWTENNKKKIDLVDQDVLNVVLSGSIKKLPEKYNVQLSYYKNEKKLSELTENIHIIHYCGPTKPWNNKEMFLSEYFWKYAKINPFYDLIRENFALQYSEMQKSEVEFIKNLIKKEQPKKILEVGIAAGSCTAIILDVTKEKDNVTISGIDYNKKYYRDDTKKSGWVANELYPELSNKLNIFTGGVAACFLDEIGDSIDFCVLDTVHILPGELLDFLMVLPYLKENAICVLHDVNLQNLPVQNGTIRVSKNADSSNLQYLGDSYATSVLMSLLASKKIFPEEYLKNFVLPNIVAFRITPELKKYVHNVFYALALPWKYGLSNRDKNVIGNFIKKHYSNDDAEYFYQIAELMNRNIEKKKEKIKLERELLNSKTKKIDNHISLIRQKDNQIQQLNDRLNRLEKLGNTYVGKLNWAIHNPKKLVKKYFKKVF